MLVFQSPKYSRYLLLKLDSLETSPNLGIKIVNIQCLIILQNPDTRVLGIYSAATLNNLIKVLIDTCLIVLFYLLVEIFVCDTNFKHFQNSEGKTFIMHVLSSLKSSSLCVRRFCFIPVSSETTQNPTIVMFCNHVNQYVIYNYAVIHDLDIP